MKSFRQFIIEARVTLASQQARQLGLQSSGHGDYYDQQGKLVAKTIGGKLEFFKGRQPKEQETKPKKRVVAPQQVAPKRKQKQPQQTTSKSKEDGKGVVITLGRFNPPARNHELLLKSGFALSTNTKYDYRIYPSRVQDKGTNPLNPSLKIQFMEIMYPDYAEYILDSEKMKTIFDILQSLYNDGYKNVKVVVGADRYGEFQSLIHKAQDFEFKNIEVVPTPIQDPDSDVGGSGSSVALRTAAAKGDYSGFASNLPSRMKRVDREQLYNSVVKSMKVAEGYEMWRIAPELDKDGLRYNYREKNLYPVGSLVENINTGLRGRVTRRGTNHLICVTEEGMMFKSWVSAVHLVEDVYEVGTDKYRDKLQRLTPGHPVGSYTGVSIKETVPKNINKLRKDIRRAK